MEISFIVRFWLSVVLRKIKKKTTSAFENLCLLLRWVLSAAKLQHGSAKLNSLYVLYGPL